LFKDVLNYVSEIEAFIEIMVVKRFFELFTEDIIIGEKESRDISESLNRIRGVRGNV
jgi:hypothetical protein